MADIPSGGSPPPRPSVSGRRLIVLEVLSAAEDRSTLREIYRRAVSRDSRVGYTTIYRTVHRLNRPWRAAPWP